VSEERSKRIHTIIEQMGTEVRKELDAARKEMPGKQYEAFHAHTVDDLIRRVKRLLVLGEGA
jgi:hypothetical protein